MRFRTIAISVALSALALFALLNWATISQRTTLNVIFATVDAPLGEVLLAAIGVLTLIYAISLAKLEVATLVESRRMTKELDRARKVAEQAEESRFHRLQDFLDRELSQANGKLDRLLDVVGRESSVTRIPD
ncbi:hypothetical protein P0D88_24605 [Paraburkholderia sp. RL18-103-BIB-C]|jgi:hypothetical protein|uniref:hypothetical protein n=1 Tax=unclassified Paraburkholderia TaxID=2615204 RepID=UPI0038BBFCD8